jgi:hypothetical protein
MNHSFHGTGVMVAPDREARELLLADAFDFVAGLGYGHQSDERLGRQ